MVNMLSRHSSMQTGKREGRAVFPTVARFHFQSSKFKTTPTFSYSTDICCTFRCHYFGNSLERVVGGKKKSSLVLVF